MVMDSDRLHLFGADGRTHRVIGRRGDGPGEFRYLTNICRTEADTVVVWDDANRRLGVLTSEGHFIRHLQVGSVILPPQGCGAGGKVLVLQPQTGTAESGRVEFTGIVMDLEGKTHARSIAVGQGSSDVVGREPSQAMVGQDIIVGDGLASEYRRLSGTGRLLQVVRTRDAPIAISRRDYDAVLDRIVPPQRNAKALRERLKKQRTATHWPAYGRILVDPVGCVWMQSFVPPSRGEVRAQTRPDTWVAFDPAGRMVGRLQIPPPSGAGRKEVLAVDRGEVQIRERTAEGLVFLHFHPVVSLSQSVACAAPA